MKRSRAARGLRNTLLICSHLPHNREIPGTLMKQSKHAVTSVTRTLLNGAR